MPRLVIKATIRAMLPSAISRPANGRWGVGVSGAPLLGFAPGAAIEPGITGAPAGPASVGALLTLNDAGPLVSSTGACCVGMLAAPVACETLVCGRVAGGASVDGAGAAAKLPRMP